MARGQKYRCQNFRWEISCSQINCCVSEIKMFKNATNGYFQIISCTIMFQNEPKATGEKYFGTSSHFTEMRDLKGKFQ